MKKRVFTLVELLVVIAIIAVLAGLAIPAVGIAKQKAKQTQARVDIHSLETAFYEYEKDKGTLVALPEFGKNDVFRKSKNGEFKILKIDFFDKDKPEPPDFGDVEKQVKAYDAIMEAFTFTRYNGAVITNKNDETGWFTDKVEDEESRKYMIVNHNRQRKKYINPPKLEVYDLIRKQKGFFVLDPWGRRYNIAIDCKYKGYIEVDKDDNGFGWITQSKTRINAKVMIFSYGSEKEDRPRNYICSWKQGK